MFWLGSGEDQPQLHNPDFDFPDAALPVGLSVFRKIVEDLTSGDDGGNTRAT
jgi:metal-dependent amidase/aminoacylase/carboxypeptidase family protein